MFNRIMVATDLSPASFAVVSSISELKVFGAKECLLVQCLGYMESTSMNMPHMKNLLLSVISDQKKLLEDQGFETSVEIVAGLPQTEVNRIAEARDCSLIVVGSHGYSFSREILLGSVTTQIIHYAKRPVLIIRLKKQIHKAEIKIENQQYRFSEHILFPTDFSENADYAFEYVKYMVKFGVKRITLVHVQDKHKIDPHLIYQLEEFNRIDMERLEKMKQQLEKENKTNIKIHIPYGVPAEEILSIIQKEDVQMVVMGSQGRSYFQEFLLGSVSHAIARMSQAPVMLIPVRKTK